MRKRLLCLAVAMVLAGRTFAQTPPPLPQSLPQPPVSIHPEPSFAEKTDGCWPAAEACPSSGPFCYANCEYLNWWVKNSPLPVPLVTTGPVPGVGGIPGALGTPGTVVLSPSSAHYGAIPGLRTMAGFWVGEDNKIALDAGFFWLPSVTNLYTFASGANGIPLVAIPFASPVPGVGQSATALSAPALGGIPARQGTAVIASSLEFWGGEANSWYKAMGSDNFSLYLLDGFQYLDLREKLSLGGLSTGLGGRLFGVDQFITRNHFYGGTLGFKAEGRFGNFFVNNVTRIGLGEMQETVSVFGQTNQVIPGAFFAQPINIRTAHSKVFAVAPQTQLNLGVSLFDHLRLQVGYNFLYISNVVRPGDQIDRVTPSLTAAPGGNVGFTQPIPQFNHTDFWAHGINAGIELRY